MHVAGARVVWFDPKNNICRFTSLSYSQLHARPGGWDMQLGESTAPSPGAHPRAAHGRHPP